MFIPLGITSLGMRNPPSFTLIQTGKIKMRGISFGRQQIQDQKPQIFYTDNFLNLIKMKNKPDPAL
jgi:hypothetical protein